MVTRRLAPLFISKFLRGLIFYYAIEKLFMAEIGFTDTGMGVMTALFAFTSVVLEIPSGILADHWSRKGTMTLSAVFLALAGLAGFVSHDVPTYLIQAVFWGMFDALVSGTDTASIYDILLEEQKHAKNYGKILGYYEALGGLAFIISSLLAGVIAEAVSVRFTFLASIVPPLIMIIVMLFHRDTTIHHNEVDPKVGQRIKETFAVVFKNRQFFWLIISFVSMMVINKVNVEMHQLWYLAFNSPVILYGVASAAIMGAYAGGMLSDFLSKNNRTMWAIVSIMAMYVILVYSRDFWITLAAQFLIGLLTFSLSVILTARIQDKLPSAYRAGSGSIINSLFRLVFVPIVILFGFLSEKITVFQASWLLICFVALGLIAELFIKNQRVR